MPVQRTLQIFLMLSTCLWLPTAVGATAMESDYVWVERFQKTMAKAKQGDAKAQYSIGRMLEQGRGTRKDLAQAFIWYQRAAEKGNTKAEYHLGYMHLQGSGTKPNLEQAYRYLMNAAQKGHSRAQYYIGRMFQTGEGANQNLELAKHWYQLAVDGGFTPAQKSLDEMTTDASDMARKFAEDAPPAILQDQSAAAPTRKFTGYGDEEFDDETERAVTE